MNHNSNKFALARRFSLQNKGTYHAVVRPDNTEPVSGKPMSAVYYDIDLKVPDDVAGLTKP